MCYDVNVVLCCGLMLCCVVLGVGDSAGALAWAAELESKANQVKTYITTHT